MNMKSKTAKKRPKLLVRLLTFVVTLALIVGAVFLVAHYQDLNFDSIKRYFTYHALERNDSGQADSFTYNSGATESFAALDGDLLLCSDHGIQLYSQSGTAYVDMQLTLKTPLASSNGKTGIVYDSDTAVLYAFRDREEVFSLSMETDSSIVTASVSSGGYVCAITEAGGYKSALKVYNPQGSAILQLSLSSRFIADAMVSPDSQQVAVLTMGVTGNSFESNVSIYPLSGNSMETPQPVSEFSLGNAVVLSMRWDDGGIWTLGDDNLTLTSPDGATLATCSYENQYLKEYTLDGDGFSALLIGKYRAGSKATLTVLSSSGDVSELAVNEQVLSISSSKRYLAVLTADRLDIYTQDLKLYHTLEGTQGAKQAMMQPDGSVMLIGTSTARLYLPS
ncbi:MAG: DUF5711 family protein [Oscillospiraceae bacterium]|nr:DUF5711 family protein [Oscillospiraceae bacterium]